MKIRALVTFWKRPEVARIFVERFKRSKPDYADLDMTAVISPDDPYFNVLKNMLKDFDVLVYKNLPLGEKRNAGLSFSMQFKWDYILDLGSDNFFTSLLWDNYREHLGADFLGLMNIYILDIMNNEAVFIRNYGNGKVPASDDMSFGAGRMYSRNICEDLVYLWNNKWDRGLDGSAHERITKKYKETRIDTNEAPVMLDIKTNTNIHHFSLLKHRGVKCEPIEIKNMFNIAGVELINPKLFDFISFDGFRNEVCRRSNDMSIRDAFNMLNAEYAVTFGKPRYKNYNSYKTQLTKNI